MQYKILSRYLVTNVLLKKIGVKPSTSSLGEDAKINNSSNIHFTCCPNMSKFWSDRTFWFKNFNLGSFSDTGKLGQLYLHVHVIIKHNLGSAFNDLDPRLFLLCQVGDDVICPCKICGGFQIRITRSIRSFTESTLSHTLSRLQFIPGVRSFYIKRNHLICGIIKMISLH